MSTSEVSPAIVQGKKERRNGDGTTFFDRKRDRWVASFYDINGIRRTQTFHKKNDADKLHTLQIKNVAGIVVHNLIIRYGLENSTVINLSP